MPRDDCGEGPHVSESLYCPRCRQFKSTQEFRVDAPDDRVLKSCGRCRTANNDARKRKAEEDEARKAAKRRRKVLGTLDVNIQRPQQHLPQLQKPIQQVEADTQRLEDPDHLPEHPVHAQRLQRQPRRAIRAPTRARQRPADPETPGVGLIEPEREAFTPLSPPPVSSAPVATVGDLPLFAEPVLIRPARELAFPGLIGNRTNPPRDDLGRADLICPACGVCHWRDELLRATKNPEKYKFSLCCAEGKHVYTPPPDPPPRIKQLFTAQNKEGKDFRKDILRYNNALSLTSCSYKDDQRLTGVGGLKSFSIQGELQHFHGRIEPPSLVAPGFAQVIFYDPDEAVQIRQGRCADLNRTLLKELDVILRAQNVHYQTYKSAFEYISQLDEKHAQAIQDGIDPATLPNTWLTISPRMALTVREGADIRRENNPVVQEFAGLIPDDEDPITKREIVLISRTETDESAKLEVISSNHSGYFPFHYVLLFPLRKGGWNATNTPGRKAALNRWGRYQLHFRPDGNGLLHYGGRLLQKLAVDMWASYEQKVLDFARSNQSNFKLYQFKDVADAIETDADLSEKGTFVYLPPSHIGSPRFMRECYQDSMAIVRKFGKPSLFVTMTANPQWKEITDELLPGQVPSDRPDVITRVFELKKKRLLRDLRTCFGSFLGNVWTLEYQKRGLPHIHILLFLGPEDSFLEHGRIDEVICAELPTPEQDPTGRLRELIERNLVHGPCGDLNPDSPCMVKGKDGIKRCSKNFPKPFQECTVVEQDGYPKYRRRNNGVSFVKQVKGTSVVMDNRWVVPYNPYLVMKYAVHCNVEVCSSIRAVKYIHKYIYKGGDLQTAELRNDKDEITSYLHTRYISPSMAICRLLAYHTHEEFPAVIKLHVHLEGEQAICMKEHAIETGEYFDPNTSFKSTLLDWFEYNRKHPDGRALLYQDFPGNYVHMKPSGQESQWRLRKAGTPAIGRMVMCFLNQGEKWFMRLLLSRVPGAIGYEHLRTINGVVHPTFQHACLALGLIAGDDECSAFFHELALTESGYLQRVAFVSVLVHNMPVDPPALWEQFRSDLCDDLKRSLERQRIVLPPVQNPEYDYGLYLISLLLERHGKTLQDFRLPGYTCDWSGTELADLAPVDDEWSIPEQAAIASEIVPKLNDGQRAAFDQICSVIDTEPLKANFFVHGPAGTGKTFLYKCLCSHYRGQGKTVLCVASSGVAALLLPGGTTSHSRFKIPIECLPESSCSIKKDSYLADLLRRTDLIIWDEVPMQNKNNFFAVDRTLRDIRSCQELFGGVPVVFGGDFAQTTPVVPRALRPGQVQASIRKAHFWNRLRILRLTVNMRMEPGIDNHNYKRWIGAISYDKQFYDMLRLPKEVQNVFSDLRSFIASVYRPEKLRSCVDKGDNFGQVCDYFRSRAILAPHNATVDSLNAIILSDIPGASMVYYSVDSVSNDLHDSWGEASEVVNSLNPPGLPQSKLELRLGAPIVVLRNLDPKAGICNGTRAVIIGLRERSIKIRVVGTEFDGSEYNLFKVSLTSTGPGLPFQITRFQFPVRLAFAMTINKSQGQSLEHVGIDLTNSCFAHGQLYVALSRVKNVHNLSVHLVDAESRTTPNIVYSEVLLPEDG